MKKEEQCRALTTQCRNLQHSIEREQRKYDVLYDETVRMSSQLDELLLLAQNKPAAPMKEELFTMIEHARTVLSERYNQSASQKKRLDALTRYFDMINCYTYVQPSLLQLSHKG